MIVMGCVFFLMDHRTMDDESQNIHPSLTFSLKFLSLQPLSVPHCTALCNQYHSKRDHEADPTIKYNFNNSIRHCIDAKHLSSVVVIILNNDGQWSKKVLTIERDLHF